MPRALHCTVGSHQCAYLWQILEEGIALKPSDIDVTWVFGYGFSRFKGGPMHYADAVGLPTIAEALSKYSAQFPDSAHLQPAPLLLKLASEGTSLTEYWASKASAR